MKLYRAVVEDNLDPDQLGRVRVRIVGIHTEKNENSDEDFNFVKTSDLPWTEIMGDTAFGLISGVGVSSVLRQGTWVWVILDDDNVDRPIVIGTIIGQVSSKTNYADGEGFNDPDGVYPKTGRENRSDMNPILDSKYPTIAVLETPSGHVIELDDTPGDLRIKLTHSSGSYILIDNAGNILINGVNNITAVAANNIIATAGNDITATAGNDIDVTASENMTLDSTIMRLSADHLELHARVSYSKDIFGYGQKFTYTGGTAYDSESWTVGSTVTPIADHGLDQPEIPSELP